MTYMDPCGRPPRKSPAMINESIDTTGIEGRARASIAPTLDAGRVDADPRPTLDAGDDGKYRSTVHAITGATGFLGAALAAELIARGETVRILARDEAKAREIFGDAVTIVPGEIINTAAVSSLVDGATHVYHLAGRLYHPSLPASLYRETHVEGTRVLLAACRDQPQLQRIVHCSTTGVHGITGDMPTAEDAPFAPTNPYEATKLEGEQLALRAYCEQGLPVSVARPGLVYGPDDLHLLGFFKSINKGMFRVIDGGKARLHPIYIDDMVTAFLLCAEHPAAVGRSYNIAGEQSITIRELAASIALALGKELPRGSIPLWAANLAADVFNLIPGVRGERAPLTRSRVAFLTSSRVYDCRRVQQELGFRTTISLATGIQQTAEWYKKQRFL